MIATRNGFEVLRFPVMQSSFSFTYVELLAVPTASLINNPGHLRTGESVFVRKKRLNTMYALENNSKVKAAVEFIAARPKQPITTVPKKEVLLILPYLGLQSRILTKTVKACINKFYGCFDLRVVFQSTRRIKSNNLK